MKHKGICMVCACTDEEACEEGCAWANVNRTICTACAPLTHIERDEKRALAMTELVMRFEALTDEALALKARMAILERDYAGPEPRQKAKR